MILKNDFENLYSVIRNIISQNFRISLEEVSKDSNEPDLMTVSIQGFNVTLGVVDYSFNVKGTIKQHNECLEKIMSLEKLSKTVNNF